MNWLYGLVAFVNIGLLGFILMRALRCRMKWGAAAVLFLLCLQEAAYSIMWIVITEANQRFSGLTDMEELGWYYRLSTWAERIQALQFLLLLVLLALIVHKMKNA